MKRFFIVCICVFVCRLTLFAQNVTNVEVYQEGKQAVITYTLDKTADVTVQVSTDGGRTFSSPLTKVTGDVGSSVSAGNKRIVWDILAERDRFVGDNIVFRVNASGVNMHNGHEYVDLGLPSGLLWATCNVFATTPEEYGYYFAWGEVVPKMYYGWSSEGDYEWGVYNSSYYNFGMTKYTTTDGKTVLDLVNDAAHVNWGGDWRIPTLAEIKELNSNCTTKWTTDYNGTGVAGRIVTSKLNGNSIFLPAAGWRGNSSLSYAGSLGLYWSSSLNTSRPYRAYGLRFASDIYDWYDYDRGIGRSVRPVCSAR